MKLQAPNPKFQRSTSSKEDKEARKNGSQEREMKSAKFKMKNANSRGRCPAVAAFNMLVKFEW
jgi:hypothetical protein